MEQEIMDRIELNLEQGSDAWKSWRNECFNASDAGVVLGLYDKRSPWDVWEEKVYGRTNENSFIFQKGHEIEAKVRAQYELTHENCPPVCFQKGIFGASLDGWNGRTGLEIKYCGKDWIDKIKPHHYAQVQTQLYVSDADKIIFLPCDGERTGEIIVEFNKEWWKENVKVLNRFWRDVLKAREFNKAKDR